MRLFLGLVLVVYCLASSAHTAPAPRVAPLATSVRVVPSFIEPQTNLSFPSSYDACPMEEAGYVEGCKGWCPFCVCLTVGAISMYKCSPESLDERPVVFRLYRSRVSKSMVVDSVNGIIWKKRGSQDVMKADYRKGVELMMKTITKDPITAGDTVDLVYKKSEVSLYFNQQHLSTLTKTPKEALSQFIEALKIENYKRTVFPK